MRPNLMSPRRASTSGEDSILAMLEREALRRRGGDASSGARLAWYGASAGLALALTGALVWMAANNDGRRRDTPESVLAEAAKLPGPLPDAGPASGNRTSVATLSDSAPSLQSDTGAALHQVAMAPATAWADVGPGSAAIIVDPPPAEAVPPLRLLTPAPAKPTAEKPAAARRLAPAARVEAKPAARPAAVPPKPRPVMPVKHAARPAPPTSGRSAGPAMHTDGPVDADVALISAVIVHANGHAPEGTQMTGVPCPNDACKARPARQ